MKITDKIITSTIEPQLKNVLWHNPETGELKMFGNKGWEVVGGNPGERGGASSFSINVLWKELKELRDSAQLIPGLSYRITDYVATTIDPESRSANHPFDIIVIADDEKTLNENARAIQHEGDKYFKLCDLAAWELKYCIDNDTNKFAWADSTNGKGVIYFLKDEHNNECPYDFKNIQFKRWAITDITSNTLTVDSVNELKNTYCKTLNGGKYFATKNTYGQWVQDNSGIDFVIDEDDYTWCYTFHGLSSNDGETISGQYDMSTKVFKITDEYLQQLENDGSGCNTQDICKENQIQSAYYEYFGDDEYLNDRMVLNNIVFVNGLSYCYYIEDEGYWSYQVGRCYGNKFGVECKNNTFGYYCYYNTFGNECNNNTFGNECTHNTFGNGCGASTFGNGFQYNTFGNGCHINTFGNSYHQNTFGNKVRYNIFGDYCYNNTFGNNWEANTFGDYCYNNTFGNNCSNNTFGNSCVGNTFGNYCDKNTFGNGFIKECRFGDGVQYCTISGYDDLGNYGTNGYYLRNIVVLNGTKGKYRQILELNENEIFNTNNFKSDDDLVPQIVCGFFVTENNDITYVAKYYMGN